MKGHNNLQLQIINAHTLLGFSKTENLIDLPCKSTKPKNVLATTNMNDGSLDNHKGDVSQSNSILLPLPVNQMFNI